MRWILVRIARKSEDIDTGARWCFDGDEKVPFTKTAYCARHARSWQV